MTPRPKGLGVLAQAGDKRARALVEEAAKGDTNLHVRDAAREVLKRLE